MDTVFLVISLFLPRTTLIIYYLFIGIPANTIPLIGDILLAVFLPRVLVIIYIVQNLGTDSPWFWIHLVVALLVYFGSGKKVKSWKSK